ANIYDVETRWDPGPGLSRTQAQAPPSSAEPLLVPSTEPQTGEDKEIGKIFISYSHSDAKWLTQVQIALRPLKIYQNIDFWDDTRIKVGSQWRSEIKDAIERAEIVILLVSKEFLASEFIANNELPPLMKAVKRRGKLIIPIILNHVFLPPSVGLDEFQSLNPHSKPLAGMSKVGQAKVFSELAKIVNTHFEGSKLR